MRLFHPWPVLLSTVLLSILSLPPVHAAAGDTIADRILGQRRFGTANPYFVDGTLLDAADIAVDRSANPNRVYIASPGLNRVLGWSDIGRFEAGAAADLVLGQPSVFNGSLFCPPVPSAATFCEPTHVAVDPAGNLYVADAFDYRVLEFDRPFATDRVADRVFGQVSFTARKVPTQEIASSLDIALDGSGNLWAIDPAGSRRILEYDAPVSHDTRPDRAIALAKPSECTGVTSPALPCSPFELEVSARGDLLYVGDRGNPSQGFIFRQPLSGRRTSFRLPLPLPGSFPPNVTFNSAGGLIFLGNSRVWRYPPPLGPGTQAEIVSPRLDVAVGGVPALDSRGNLLVANIVDQNSFVFVVDAPFQSAVLTIGRISLTDRGLATPDSLAIDRSSSPNHLYVVDATDRVLAWRDASGFANGDPADLVIPGAGPSGPGNQSPDCFNPAPGAAKFCPYSAFVRGGLAVDSRGNLWLSDVAYNRVLEFDRPFENDAIADRVLGQGGSFDSGVCNLGGVTARSLCRPGALAFDFQDHLYVADLANQRVLLFEHPLTDDAAAKVFGQPDFTQSRCNQGQPSAGAATLCLGATEGESNPRFVGASGLAIDPQGNLYVADTVNVRILIYQDPLTTDAVADHVLGQPDFQQRLYGKGPRRFGAGNLAVAAGPAGELYVADPVNDRVLEFLKPLQDSAADRVFGHADFATGGVFAGLPPPPTVSNLLGPMGVAVDTEGNLYVADSGYDRVLEFDTP
jgi:DNA-binding beta-propeller fold protein YncE